MKKIILSILTVLIFCSAIAQAGTDSWKTSICSFLNDNKKYIGYGAALLTAGGLMYSGYKKTGAALLALTAGFPLYRYAYNQDTVPSTISFENSEEEDAPVKTSTVENSCNLSHIRKKSFDTWYEECNKFPEYVSGETPGSVGIRKRTLGPVIDAFIKMQEQRLSDARWLKRQFKSNKSCIKIFDTSINITGSFLPFVQKLEVQPNDVIAFHGDLHGDVHSLLESIKDLRDKGYMDSKDPFKIKDKNFKLVFLGDYVDRGWYGAEVIYTILRLKLENPDQVFLVRGNHEDVMINSAYGFLGELERKWDDSQLTEFCNKIHTMYTLMPVALYIGSADKSGNKDFIQCCHGGMEIGYNPQELLQSNADYELIEKLHIRDNLSKLKLSPRESTAMVGCLLPAAYNRNLTPQQFIAEECPFGYQWNDFDVDPTQFLSYGRSLKCGRSFTQKILEQHSSKTHRVCGVFRAHQHSGDPENDMMKRITNADTKGHDDDRGCGKLWIPKAIDPENTKKLWPGIVCTFSVSPNTPYKPALREIGETYGLLRVKPGFENWHLDMVRINEQQRQDVTEEDQNKDKGKEKIVEEEG